MESYQQNPLSNDLTKTEPRLLLQFFEFLDKMEFWNSVFLKDLTFFINANNASSILFEDMKNFKAEICLFCWVHFCFALLGYFQRRLQMNGISFILSSGHEAPPHHKCMMDASAQSEFSTHEALSVISHAKERSNKVCCNYTVVQQVLAYLKKYWNWFYFLMS